MAKRKDKMVGTEISPLQTLFNNKPKLIFYILLTAIFMVGVGSIVEAKGWLIPSGGAFHVIGDNVFLDRMSTQQKVAQMMIIGGHRDNLIPARNMQVGGIHLFAMETEHIFNNTVIDFQYQMPIPFFVTADQEGCVSPFGHIRNFTAARQIDNIGDAFEKGFREGEFMARMGFNLNFAPVVDLEDDIWNCRTFPGNVSKIAELAQAYSLGLQNNGIIATAKHYPGKTLIVKDPHKFVVAASINEEDVYPYQYLSERGDVQAVMVSHLITSGEVNSQGIPSVVSPEVIGELKEHYDGLIISDEIHMLGLKNFFDTVDEMYIAVYNAGNDIILNFDRDPNEVYRMIQVVARAVDAGVIDEANIDSAVTKILEAKGFKVR